MAGTVMATSWVIELDRVDLDYVALSLEKVPDHVMLDPKSPVIKKGDKDVRVTVKAGAVAGLSDHEITVVGKPTTWL